MTTEKQKAYEEWWSDPASPNNTKDIFFAGWEAGLQAPSSDREFLRAKIMDKAIEAFRNRLDETARLYREMAEELFGKP